MKILIGYDGSEVADAALDDLQRAGLPETAEAIVISVAEVWLPPQPENKTVAEFRQELEHNPLFHKTYHRAINCIQSAEKFAERARQRLQTNFPQWKVTSEATYGSPAWEIIMRADAFEPDLIITGAHGRSAFETLIMGSISQKVLTEANCSVRVARGKIEVDDAPVRIVVGFDGSPGAEAAVESLSLRRWKQPCEVRLITATDSLLPTADGHYFPSLPNKNDQIDLATAPTVERLAEKMIEKLNSCGFLTSFHLEIGNPKKILLTEAENWSADCIFVGANAFGSRIERFLIGSVSSAIAARAHCSVEVVRKKVL
jgi:nucleotide-binding universal stress UspA family protein